jgi:hypothetical protein
VENGGPIGRALSHIPGHDSFNLLEFFIAIVLAWVSHAIQLHNRLSDAFGIRNRFDRNYILLPLAVLTGVQLSPIKLNALKANRELLMEKVFYRYASSRADKPLVDKHHIERALDTWSWYWILVEGAALWLVGGLIAGYFASYSLMNLLCWVAVGFWLFGELCSLRHPGFAQPQIETIVGNVQAKQDIKEAFDAL